MLSTMVQVCYRRALRKLLTCCLLIWSRLRIEKHILENALKLAGEEVVFDIARDVHEFSHEQGVISQISSCD